jgi:Lrp/AsnC family leucine-responsive transcriptional regulator
MAKIELDAIDRRLLQALQENGRLSITELAEKVGLTSSPCLRRLRMLEQAGIIRGYAALLDQEKLGLPVSVFVSVKLEMQREAALERFEAAMRDCPEVVECYLMTGPRDYLLRVVAADLAASERFLKETLTRIEGVASIESSFALTQVKYANALPVGAEN